jgi:hypothetical protein
MMGACTHVHAFRHAECPVVRRFDVHAPSTSRFPGPLSASAPPLRLLPRYTCHAGRAIRSAWVHSPSAVYLTFCSCLRLPIDLLHAYDKTYHQFSSPTPVVVPLRVPRGKVPPQRRRVRIHAAGGVPCPYARSTTAGAACPRWSVTSGARCTTYSSAWAKIAAYLAARAPARGAGACCYRYW